MGLLVLTLTHYNCFWGSQIVGFDLYPWTSFFGVHGMFGFGVLPPQQGHTTLLCLGFLDLFVLIFIHVGFIITYSSFCWVRES
jgi:hypothetical protein